MEYKKNKLNVAVIGSGASAFGVVQSLLENKNVDITVISDEINDQNNTFDDQPKEERYFGIRSNFDKPLIGKKIDKKYSYSNYTKAGGLSDYWSGSLAIPESAEIKKWNLNDIRFDKYYKIISKYLPISGEQNKKTPYFLPKNYINQNEIKISNLLKKFYKNFENSKNFYLSKNFLCVYTSRRKVGNICNFCSDCFNGCKKDAIFRPSRVISKLISEKKLRYINKKINKIRIKDEKFTFDYSNNQLIFDKIYLCSGAINTAKIIINSFGLPKKRFFIYDIPSHTYICLNFLKKVSYNLNYFGFANLVLKLKTKNKNYILCGNLPLNIFKKIFRFNKLSKFIKKIFEKRFFYFQIFGDQKNYDKLVFDKNLELKKYKQGYFDSKKIVKNLNGEFIRKGFYLISYYKMTNSSSHYSSNLFNAYNLKKNKNGVFKKNLYICDSSSFNAPSSSVSHTFFLIANAYRIAKKSLNDQGHN